MSTPEGPTADHQQSTADEYAPIVTSPEYDAALAAIARVRDADERISLSLRLLDELREVDGGLIDGSEIQAGQVLVGGGCLLPVESVEDDLSSPDLTAIETPLGTLYVANEETYEVISEAIEG